MLALLANLPRQYQLAQLEKGVVVMVLGMLVVFAFLVILIAVTKAMSKICMKFAKPEAPKKAVSAAAPAAKKNDDSQIAIAIAAAVDKAR